MKNEITKRETPEEQELRKKQAELEELEGRLGEKELELATFRAELNTFEAIYIRIVGVKYAELDEIEAKIAEAKLQENPSDKFYQEEAINARSRAKESKEATGQLEEVIEEFKPSESLKKLYREVAKRIHPDLAEDNSERLKRKELMAMANRAYQEGDSEKLQSILAEWENSPESVKGDTPGAQLIRVIRKIAQAEKSISKIDAEIEQLINSDLFQLKLKVEKAEKEDRDILDEMASNLEKKIKAANEELNEIIKKVSNNE